MKDTLPVLSLLLNFLELYIMQSTPWNAENSTGGALLQLFSCGTQGRLRHINDGANAP